MKTARPHYHGHRHRLRKRFLKHGLEGLSDHEVVELLLTLAIPRSDVKLPAKALLARFGDLRGILDAPIAELSAVHGLGEVAPVALRIIREAASLYLQQSAADKPVLVDPEALVRFWRTRIGALPREVFEVGYLDSGYRLMRDGIETVAAGTVDRATIYPRTVVESALKRGAAAVVVAHNHPSGDVQPTEQDKSLTRALVLATAAVQIKVVDHLVVSPDRVFSFRAEGLL